MNTDVQEKPAAPLGVIGCLTAGFEIVGHNLWLVVLPMLLDLFLWLGPRLSIAPLVDGFVQVLHLQPVPDPAMSRQLTQAAQLLQDFAGHFNLFSVLSGLPLVTLPSLLASHTPEAISPLGPVEVVAVDGLFSPLVLLIGLTGVGLVLGIVYLTWLASRVYTTRVETGPEGPVGALGQAPPTWSRLVRVLLFAVALVVAGWFLVPLWLLMVALAFMIAPVIGLLFWLFSVTMGIFMLLHMLFVIHGVLLGGRGLMRATWESVLLVRSQLGAVIGLVGLIFVIYQGLGFVWALPKADSWALLVGVIGNGCIATGLTAATFVFYQERLRLLFDRLRAQQVSTKT